MRFRPNFHSRPARRSPELPPCDPADLRRALVESLSSVSPARLPRVREVLLSLGVSPEGIIERGSPQDPFSPDSGRHGWMSVARP